MNFDPDSKLDAGWCIVIVFILGWLSIVVVVVNGIVRKLELDYREIWNLGMESFK